MDVDVWVIEDDELPMEQDFCFVRVAELFVFVVKRSRAASPRVLREAWAVARSLGFSPGPRLEASA